MDGFNIQIFPIVRDGEFTLVPFHGSMSFRREGRHLVVHS
jgi:hypothetical protein